VPPGQEAHLSIYPKSAENMVGHPAQVAHRGVVIRVGGSFQDHAAEVACGASPQAGATFYSSLFRGSHTTWHGVPAVHAKVDELEGILAYTRISKSLRPGTYSVKLACGDHAGGQSKLKVLR
jgi:hypothetical protein